MAHVDSFFAEMLRFNVVALVLLAATLAAVKRLSQPVERVRVIQISLLALVAVFALCLIGVLPTVELALLPAESQMVAKTNPTPALGPPPTSQDAASGELPLLMSEGAATDPRSAIAPAAPKLEGETDVAIVRGADSDLTIHDPARASFVKRLVVYGFGIASLLNALYLAVGFAAAQRLIAKSTALPPAASRRVKALIDQFAASGPSPRVRSAQVAVPMVSGVWRPTILLPIALTRDDADATSLKLSLLHELGHIRRRDLLSWQMTSLCQVFLWLQPFYWVLRRELRVAQDQLADQFATQQTEHRATYAETLLRLFRAKSIVSPSALAMVGGKSNLYRRIELLTSEGFEMIRTARRTVVLPFAGLTLFAGVMMTSLQLTRAAPTSTGSPSDQNEPQEDGADVAEIPATGESVEHSGIVIDVETGAPIAGVTVTVTRMNSHDWRELAVTESITDDNGRYTFTIPPDQLSQRLLYIMFDVEHPQYARRHCGSYGYGMIVENLKHGEQPWFSELKMVRGEKVFGRLVDEKGRPVAGAALRIDSRSKSGSGQENSSWIKEVSGEDGRFEAVVTHDGIAKLSIIPLDHCMKYVEIGEKRGDIGDVVLEPGLPIHGVVQDAEGRPMEGLWVNLTPDDERKEASYEMKRSSKTNRQGEFQTRPLRLGKYQVDVELKATGAIDKQRYANFHNDPPPAMFVQQTVNVT
ncbi:MAG: M56 family metallopeptidase, partial [Planctomycetota bacterium]